VTVRLGRDGKTIIREQNYNGCEDPRGRPYCCSKPFSCCGSGCCAGTLANPTTCCENFGPTGEILAYKCCPSVNGVRYTQCCGNGNCCPDGTYICDNDRGTCVRAAGAGMPAARAVARGLFDAGNGKWALFCDIASVADSGDANSFTDTSDIHGGCFVYDLGTRVVTNQMALSFITGQKSAGGDLSVSATGSASVGGNSTNVEIDLSDVGGVPSFELRNSDTMAVLAGGTGEAGHSDITLQIVTA
jgi:hypothetical protein